MEALRFRDIERALEEVLGDPDEATGRKRRRIAEAATELFIRHGYRRASVDEIARQAGVAKGTVYLYFKTKADLLVYAVAAEKQQYLAVVRDIIDGDLDPRAKLRAYLREAVLLLQQMPLTSRLVSGDQEILAVFEDLEGGVRERHQGLQVAMLARLLDPAAGAHRWTEEELTDRAQVLLALLYGLGFMVEERIRGALPLERFAGLLADIVVDGLCPTDGRNQQSKS